MQDKSMITLPWESLNRMEAGRDPEAGAVCGKGMDAGGNLRSVLSGKKDGRHSAGAANRSCRTGFGSDKEQKGDREG